MRFEATPRFKKDWKKLKPEHQAVFRKRLPDFNTACDAHVANPATVWPATLRVSQLIGFKNVWEMTWSFSGPDGRATFEFFVEDGETRLRWRRIGDHSIYTLP